MLISKWSRRLPVLGALVLLVTGCDLDVATPDQGEESEIENVAAISPFVRGASGKYAFASSGGAGYGGLYLAGALLSDELVHVGLTPGHRAFSDGIARDNQEEVRQMWAAASEARWVAEDVAPRVKRLIENESSSGGEVTIATESELVTALLWAGFSNRLMGDNFCEAVINGGAAQDHKEFYKRAEAHFTAAINASVDVGRDTLRQIAHGGRAQVRAALGDWAGAVADAAQVQDFVTFSHSHGYHVFSDTDWNFMALQLPQRRFSVWGTPFEQYLRRSGAAVGTGDPRGFWIAAPTASPFGDDARRPWSRPSKFSTYSQGVIVLKGPEMRLIEAEAMLVAGNWQGAIGKINEVREFRRGPFGGLSATERNTTSLPNVSATNLTQAWDLLMRERGIELYLEGRRLGDLRRWAKTPGFVNTTVVRQAGPGAATTDVRRNVLDIPKLCIPVSAEERRTNPNY